MHLLERQQRADKVLLQLAIEHADNSPVTQGAEQWLATGSCDWLWLRRTHRPMHAAISDCIRVFDTGGSVLGMVCEGERLLSWGGSRAQVWDLHSGEELCAYEEHSKNVDGVRLLSSELALSWSWDQTLQTWDIEEAETLQIYNGHTDLVTGLVALSDTQVLSWSKDRTLRVWQLGETESQAVLTGHESAIAGACGLSGNRVMSWERSASEKRVQIWDANTGACLESRPGPSDGIFSVHPENNRVICFQDELLRVETLDGEELLRLEGHTDDLSFAALLEDGRLLSGDWAGEMLLWNGDNGDLLQRFAGHSGSVGGAELLSDGRFLSWDDNSLRLWDAESGEQIKTFDGHSGSVRTVMVLDNGRFVSASFDGTLRLWKAGQPQKKLSVRGTIRASGAQWSCRMSGC